MKQRLILIIIIWHILNKKGHSHLIKPIHLSPDLLAHALDIFPYIINHLPTMVHGRINNLLLTKLVLHLQLLQQVHFALPQDIQLLIQALA